MTRLRKTSLLLLASDLASILVAFNVVGYLRGVGQHFIFSPLFVPAGFLVLAIYLIDGYKERTEMQHLDYASLHVIAATGATLATLLLTFVLFPNGYELQQSRAVIALSFLVLIPITLSYRRLLGHRATASRSGRSLLFVGDAASREAFRVECEKMGMTQYVIYATLHPASADEGMPSFASVLAAIQTGKSAVEAIILRESHRDLGSDMAHTLMELYFGGVPTFTLELFHQVYWQKIPLYRLNPTWLFQEGFQIAREPVFERLKRASDVLLAGLGLVAASPVILAAALAVWIEDRYSPWFFQTRIGRYQVPFPLCKIRTMRPKAPGDDLYTRTNDPRITRIGNLLRRSRIDELPQLWNVLRGDMSLIGPRAEWDRLVADYEAKIPCYSYRHLVKPGITGWAQINYPYGASLEDTLRKLEYDLYYIRHFSFLLDASIAVRTIQIMLFGKGEMSHHYDFAVIGGGSAGFNAARVAAAQGLRTAVIDGAKRLSGLCILQGCMPSKTLLYSTEVLHRAQQGRRFGLRIPQARGDMAAVQARKRRIIDAFAGFRERQLEHGKFELVRAQAHFEDPHTLALSDGRRLTARKFLIATGSKVSFPAIPGLREARPWTSDEALELERLPKSVLVLGGGLVAVELAQFLLRMGVRLTLLQRSPQLLKGHTPEAAGTVAAALRAEGAEILTGVDFARVARRGAGFEVAFRRGRKSETRRAEACLNALGREPNTATLNLAAAGVRADERGQIRINRHQQTTAPHIYAAGDCSGPVEIVHIAVQQGELAARHAAGSRTAKPVDFDLLLSVVFTDPQVAAIGIPELTLQARKVRYLSASYPFDDHGKSILMEAKRGFVKVLAEPRRGRLLGAEIVGPDAGELIHVFSGPLAQRATVFDLLRAPWYHPTLAEIVTYPLEEIAEKIK